MATPKRLISAKPRVTRAARALSPYPRPSDMPVARATTFLTAPANSTPTRSPLTYARRFSLVISSLQRLGVLPDRSRR